MAHALRQRRAGLLALFDSVGALDLEGTTAHTIALCRQPGAAGVTVPIAQLTAFLRSARLVGGGAMELDECCLLYTSPSPRDLSTSRMPSSA